MSVSSIPRAAAVLLPIILLASFAAAVPADDVTPPFVAGFDRFAAEDPTEDIASGKLLLTELNCTACHRSDNKALAPKQGPVLSGAGVRLKPEWMRRFLQSPHEVKPATTMPDVLATLPQDERSRAATALVAFLETQRQPLPELVSTALNPVEPKFWNNGDAARGRVLYHRVGCVACHAPDDEFQPAASPLSEREKMLARLDPEDLEELGLADLVRPVRSVPHPDLAAKYGKESLAHFLLDPALVRTGGRMPSLKLRPIDAADLVAYLQRQPNASPSPTPYPAPTPDLIAEGSRLFVQLRCASCHQVGSEMPPVAAVKPLDEINPSASRSCLRNAPSELPHYALDDKQVAVVAAALTNINEANEPETVDAHVQFTMLQSNCYACHERDGRGGVGPERRAFFEVIDHVDLGDEGRIPPPLDGVGRKLKQAWIGQVLQGKGDVRPHMFARMPVFAGQVIATLPSVLVTADGGDSRPADKVFDLESASAEAGRALLNVGCVQCHTLNGERLPGVIGVDIANIGNRINPEWFRDFLLNPAGLKARTRMPTLFPAGVSANPEILEGNVELQIASMWSYLSAIDRLPLPQRLEDEKLHDYELVPDDRPLLLRTFMAVAGTQAIAVGDPREVHYAFDAEQVRPAQAWRGRFLDAHGTWFNRFSPLAEPLGTDTIELPPGNPFAILRNEVQSWPADTGEEAGYRFQGYRLDRHGVPTFLYRYRGTRVEDRLQPNEDGQLQRHLKVFADSSSEPSDGTLYFRAHVGKSLMPEGPRAYSSESGLTVEADRPGTVRSRPDGDEWLIPVNPEDSNGIEVIYRW